MKRFVLSTLVILLSFYATTWIFGRYSLSFVTPHSNGYYLSKCAWRSWPNGVFNLSLFSGVDITGEIHNSESDSEYYHFIYTPCSNKLKCTNNESGAMIEVYNDSHRNTMCVPLIRWDNGTTNPYHLIHGHTELWTFNYSHNSGYVYNNDTVVIEWVCDPFLTHGDWYTTPNSSFYFQYAGSNHFYFSFGIFSAAACNRTNITNITTTTTTQGPVGECFWNIGNHMLNLTAFKNQTLATIDNNNNSLVVAISPCDNLLTCNNEKVMSYRVDYLHNSHCIDYLAIWESGFVEPKYDSSKKIWQFIYQNGEKCGGFERIFGVYWQCDYQKMNSAEIVTFLQTGTCSFEMHINSSYACA